MKMITNRKISPKMVQKAYSLEEYTSIDTKDEEADSVVKKENQLPEEFYRVMGKILTFVEKADTDIYMDTKVLGKNGR